MPGPLPAIVLMGVSGAGKTTIGAALAQRLGTSFIDADDLHSAAAKAKMASGTPLDDADRAPWLERVAERLRQGGVVVACSALTRAYRNALGGEAVFFLHLSGSRRLIAERLAARAHEYMPAALLESQFDLLEPLTHDEHGTTVSIDAPINTVVTASERLIRETATPQQTGPFALSGRRALVTGSSRGIGRSIADGLLRAGASVVLHGRDPDRLEQTRRSFVESHGEDHVGAVAFDITDDASVRAGIAQVEASGPIDVLVNNAGVQHRVPMLELAVEDWERVIRTDLTAAFLVGRTVARGMIARGHGKIINIASVQTDLARPTIAAYTAAKGGLRNLTRAMTAEWAGSNLQINALAPGYIHTEMTQALVDDEQFNSWILGRTPAHRWGSTDDLVGPAVWLASGGSDFVNGQVIFVDGGMTVVV